MRNRPDPYEEAGAIIRIHRKRKKLTLKQLSRRLAGHQLSETTLCRIETGQRKNLPIDTLAILSRELEINPALLTAPFFDARPTRLAAELAAAS